MHDARRLMVEVDDAGYGSNRERLREQPIARMFFAEVVDQARPRELLSADHFTHLAFDGREKNPHEAVPSVPREFARARETRFRFEASRR